MNPSLIRKVYRLHGIKKKAFRWFKTARGMNEERQRQMLASMKRQLTRARNDGYRVIYLDETMFTRKTIKAEEWSLPKENFRIDEARLNEPTLAMISAIGRENGRELFKIYPNSVDADRFIEYLVELRDSCGPDKVALFMDNLPAHKSKRVTDEMRRLGFRWIWNVPYSPQYNPIELVFSKVK